MLGFSTYAALLPELRDAWGMSNAQAGVVGGIFFAGYVGTVSLWTSLTDRMDGRIVYLVGGVLAAAGGIGFGLFANGFWSASFCQILLGLGMAATYMPGLRLLSDRMSGAAQSRAVSFYTSFFGVGTALSLAIAGFVAPAFGWRAAFVWSGLGPLAAAALVWFFIHPSTKAPSKQRFSFGLLFPFGAWRRVLANRACAGYTLGYTVHCMELFGSRAWMVAFMGFAAGLHAGDSFPWRYAAIAAVINLSAVPASILGNEAALRMGRRRWILAIMTGSGLAGMVVAFGASWHWAIVIALLMTHAMLVMADSGTLTAGLVGAAPPELRGAAMGLYSLLGFGGGMLGPVVFGAALDAAGGASRPGAWVAAYAAIGFGCLAAPFVVRFFGRT